MITRFPHKKHNQISTALVYKSVVLILTSTKIHLKENKKKKNSKGKILTSMMCLCSRVHCHVCNCGFLFTQATYIGVCVCCDEEGEAAAEDDDSEEAGG